MTEINDKKKQEILTALGDLENEKGITIIHAVESGSRAWGFPSQDSDYDVRILYHHAHEWYLSPFDKKDSIDIPITDDLDIAGWDLRKTLGLLYKGNATVHEWLHSPIVYSRNAEKYAALREFSIKAFNASPAFYHYISLTKKKLLDDRTRQNAKAFLYGLRALLCAHWIADYNSAPPVRFAELSAHYLNATLTHDLECILQEKATQCEKDTFAIPDTLWAFCMERHARISQHIVDKKKQGKRSDYEQLLRKIVM